MLRSVFLLPLIVIFKISGNSRADWPLFLGDPARSGYCPEATTAGLVELWQTNLGSPIYTSR